MNYYFYLIGAQHISLHFVDFKNKEKGRTKENERICKRSCWQNAITLFHLYYNKLDKLISGGEKKKTSVSWNGKDLVFWARFNEGIAGVLRGVIESSRS